MDSHQLHWIQFATQSWQKIVIKYQISIETFQTTSAA